MEDERLSVLVVEDDVATRETTRMLLEIDGYRVAGAGNGQEALNLLQEGERPALILLDLTMPIMDGPQFRRLQLQDAALARVPVLILSADADVARKAVALGASGYLRKPADPAELLALVRHHCRRNAHDDRVAKCVLGRVRDRGYGTCPRQ